MDKIFRKFEAMIFSKPYDIITKPLLPLEKNNYFLTDDYNSKCYLKIKYM